MSDTPDHLELIFTAHASRRMFEESVRPSEVRIALQGGETIHDYPDDKPYPSRLILGWVEENPVHVVLGYDEATGKGYVVTAYRPSPALWSEDFRTRKRP